MIYININYPAEIYNDPLNWNNYFIWHEKTPKVIMHKNGVNFNTDNINFVRDYTALLDKAVNTSFKNTQKFKEIWFIKPI